MTSINNFKRIVCLANSRKLGGRCVAGKEILLNESGGVTGIGDWIRPVSARPSEEVSLVECRYEDRSAPQVLDLVSVPVVGACPHDYQQENWLIDSSRVWQKISRITSGHLNQITDPVSQLWTNGNSTYSGLNDRVAKDAAVSLSDSLRLLKVSSLTISVFETGADFGNPRRRVQGRFQHDNDEYRLWITDPIYQTAYLRRPDDDYPLGECFLTVSISEPYQDGHSYKLIAAIIPA